MQVVDSKLPADAGEIHLVLDNYGIRYTKQVGTVVVMAGENFRIVLGRHDTSICGEVKITDQ